MTNVRPQTKITWQKVKLGNVLEKVIDNRGKTPPLSNHGHELIETFQMSINSKYPNLTDKSKQKYVSEETYNTWFRSGHPKEGDILFSTVGASIPQWCFVPKNSKYCIAQNLIALRPDRNKVIPEYLKSYFSQKKFVKEVKGIIIGAAQPSIKVPHLLSLEIVIPSPEEQKRIAAILSAFDDKIELNNKISRTLEQMAQAIFKEWFINKSKFKNQNAKLSELVKTQYGYTESASEKEIGPKFLRVMDINKTDWVDWDSVPYCKIGDVEFPKYKLKKGDVVIARMADPGKVAIIEEDIDAVFASYLIRLQIISHDITSYFLFYYLRSRLYQDFIFGASTGTTRQSANAHVITDVELTVPPKEKILEFENLASTIRGKMLTNVKENQKLAALRDLLLPKLMSGEIRV